MAREVRKITLKVHDALAEGVLSWQSVAEAALAYMSEDDIADMAHENEWFLYEQDQEEDLDDDDTDLDDDFFEDYNSTGSRHHY